MLIPRMFPTKTGATVLFQHILLLMTPNRHFFIHCEVVVRRAKAIHPQHAGGPGAKSTLVHINFTRNKRPILAFFQACKLEDEK
jgi:hypothetical protein